MPNLRLLLALLLFVALAGLAFSGTGSSSSGTSTGSRGSTGSCGTIPKVDWDTRANGAFHPDVFEGEAPASGTATISNSSRSEAKAVTVDSQGTVNRCTIVPAGQTRPIRVEEGEKVEVHDNAQQPGAARGKAQFTPDCSSGV